MGISHFLGETKKGKDIHEQIRMLGSIDCYHWRTV